MCGLGNGLNLWLNLRCCCRFGNIRKPRLRKHQTGHGVRSSCREDKDGRLCRSTSRKRPRSNSVLVRSNCKNNKSFESYSDSYNLLLAEESTERAEAVCIIFIVLSRILERAYRWLELIYPSFQFLCRDHLFVGWP